MWLLVDSADSCGPHAAESQAAHNTPLDTHQQIRVPDTHQQIRARRHTPTDTGARRARSRLLSHSYGQLTWSRWLSQWLRVHVKWMAQGAGTVDASTLISTVRMARSIGIATVDTVDVQTWLGR